MITQCSYCFTALKPLFTGLYCPNDCDRRTLPGGPSPLEQVVLDTIQRAGRGFSVPLFHIDWAAMGHDPEAVKGAIDSLRSKKILKSDLPGYYWVSSKAYDKVFA